MLEKQYEELLFQYPDSRYNEPRNGLRSSALFISGSFGKPSSSPECCDSIKESSLDDIESLDEINITT
jgi:hypothetical protein